MPYLELCLFIHMLTLQIVFVEVLHFKSTVIPHQYAFQVYSGPTYKYVKKYILQPNPYKP
jgi:hypothetical protein